MPTLTMLNDPHGLGIGARHITVSTVGVLPGIVALASARSSSASRSRSTRRRTTLRRTLMPINTKYPLADVIEAARRFDRRVTFEYVMLGGVNDAIEHAIALAALARDCGAFVNLIPLHPGGAGDFVPTTPDGIATLRGRAAARRASRWRCGRAAASTSPRRAGSYGWNGSAGGRHVARRAAR